MRSRSSRVHSICWALAALVAGASPAAATDYVFTQTGYSGGGVVSGHFQGVDLDNNGQIVSWQGEVLEFSLTFSGDAVVPDFTHDLSNLFGLVYVVGSAFIGDTSFENVIGWFPEGIGSQNHNAAAAYFATGLGPAGMFGGKAEVMGAGAFSTTDSLVAVSAVPEPGPAPGLLSGLLIIGILGWLRGYGGTRAVRNVAARRGVRIPRDILDLRIRGNTGVLPAD